MGCICQQREFVCTPTQKGKGHTYTSVCFKKTAETSSHWRWQDRLLWGGTNCLCTSCEACGECSPPLASSWVFASSLLCLSRMRRGVFSFISVLMNTVVFCEVFVYMSLPRSLLSGEPLIYLLRFPSTGVDRGSYGLTVLFRVSGRCWYHSS